MYLKNNKGITIIALIITVILMLILIGVGIYYGTDVISKAQLEDIKTDMISIKTKAKIVAEEYNFKDRDTLLGTKLDQANEYIITQELKNILATKDNLYVWTNEDLQNQKLSSINVNNENFYIVYYNLEDTNSCEVYYSKGYDNKYSLSELQ